MSAEYVIVKHYSAAQSGKRRARPEFCALALTVGSGRPTLVVVTVPERLNERVKRAQASHGISHHDLAKHLGVSVRTVNARFAGTAQWTLDELEVLARLFFNGNFGSMLNEPAPVQGDIREVISEEVVRIVSVEMKRVYDLVHQFATFPRQADEGVVGRETPAKKLAGRSIR